MSEYTGGGWVANKKFLDSLNIGNALGVLALGVGGVITEITTDAQKVFMGLYLIFFALLLLSFEFMSSSWMQRYEWDIRQYCGFLFDYRGRAFFIIFVSVICFSFGTFGTVIGAVTLFNSVCNITLLRVRPEMQLPGRDIFDAVPASISQVDSSADNSKPPANYDEPYQQSAYADEVTSPSYQANV